MSVTARLNRLRIVATDVATDLARTTVRVATPVVSATTTKVRSRLQREPQPVRASPPAPTRAPAAETGQVAATSAPTGPSPASVARNIAPHPPAPKPAAKKTVRPSAPGAKLPPRRSQD